MRYVAFFVGFALSVALMVESALAMTRSDGLTLEQISEAPWVFVGEVKSVETVTDGKTPFNFQKKWQARYTRFTVIHGIKGPFDKGDEIELKECAERDLPSQPFCGSLYPSARVAKAGERFFVVTGPGNPNVYDYQTSIRFPATEVPKTIQRMPLPGSATAEGNKNEAAAEDFMKSPVMRESESGWLIDLSRLSKRQKEVTSEGTSSANGFSPAGSKQKALSSPMENQDDELSGGLADLNKLIDRMGGRPVKE